MLAKEKPADTAALYKPVTPERMAVGMPLVSIIIPFYNAEKTIGRCIESVLNQTYKDFELILLDDGSTDDSGRICDAFAGKDMRIQVLHKENSGVSDTRNRGIAMAKGEYLQFLDSDDWITPTATEIFVRTVTEQKCDMVIADFYRVIGERVSQKGDIEKEGLLDRAGYASNMMQKPADFYYGVLWNKFYKRSIIEKYGIKMDTSISWCEDFLFNMEYVRHIRSAYVLKVPVYYYVKTKGSLVTQGMSMKKTIRMKRTVFGHYNSFYKDVFGDEDYEKRKGQIYRFLFDAAGDGSVSSFHSSGNYRLGDERGNVSESILEGEGIFFDLYREKKLWEKLFDITAVRNNLTAVDVKLLYCLSQSYQGCTEKEIAEILGISGRALSAAIKRLLAQEMILPPGKPKRKARKESRAEGKQQEDKKKTIMKEYGITPEAEAVLSEVLFLEQILYGGFQKREIETYEKLDGKRKKNIKEALKM